MRYIWYNAQIHMPKFNPKALQFYVQTLQDVLSAGEDAAVQVEPFYTKLRDALDADTVADMPTAEFAEINAEFDDAVDIYARNAEQLAKVQVPVRAMGAHKALVSHYQAYAQATADMRDAVQVDGQSVDMVAFEASEAQQAELMAKIQVAVQKVMMALR